MGTDVAKLLEAALAGGLPLVGSLLGFALRWKLAVLADLEEGCQTLTQLREDTKEALASGAEYLRAYRVVLGENDRIVSPNRFVNDPKARVSRGKGHLSVCKPLTGELEFETVEFLEPVQHVRSCL